MAKRVEVQICEQTYGILVEEESGSDLSACAAIVDREMSDVLRGGLISRVDGAVLAGLNIADQYYKERKVSDSLRAQLKAALDEAARLNKEVEELKKAGGGKPGGNHHPANHPNHQGNKPS